MPNVNQPQDRWDIVIEPSRSLFQLRLKEVWRYRDLLTLFVRRDFVSNYKQTVLGPLWFFIQPIFTTIMFTVVFGRLAGLSTDGIPPLLFYMAGITCWNYFADCLNKTSTTFKDNQGMFGKVYFPRLIVPISVVVTNGLKFLIQFSLFLLVYAYFLLVEKAPIVPNGTLLLLPVLILLLAMLGLGFGIIFTSLTTKYRDLVFLLQFGIQLAMYATPIIYPLSSVPERYRDLALLNPMAPIVEAFRYGFLGGGHFEWASIGYSAGFACVLLLLGMAVFNHTERSFVDTV
jgi:lipopolysaccharide transport system permease protein